MAYIEIEKAIAEIDKGDLLVGNNAEWAKEILYRTPTADVVEVVSCSECKYNPNYKRSKGMVWCRKFRQDVCSDGFCSYGERRTDDE